MTKSRKILILGIVAVLLILTAVFPYDTDDSYNAVMEKYGYDTGERTLTTPCATDGVETVRAPFGTISRYCDTRWFVLFNIFPFQTKSDDIQSPKVRVLPEMTSAELALFGIDVNDIPDGWYAHRLYEGANTIFLTKEHEQKLPLGTELGAVGGYMLAYTLPIADSPEEWINGHVDFDDVLTLDYQWDFLNGRRHLRVNHQTPGADARTDYFLAYDRVAIAQLYPLESDTETKTAYIQFLHNAVASLTDADYSRDVLRENCAQEIPRELIDDSTADYENSIVTMYWWDAELQSNKALSVPYEPEINFEGCSESAKELLQHIQRISDDDTAEQMNMDTINSTVASTKKRPANSAYFLFGGR